MEEAFSSKHLIEIGRVFWKVQLNASDFCWIESRIL